MQPAPDVLLLISPNCAHCRSLLQHLSELIKQAKIGRLEVINIAVHSEIADKFGVRTVPWMKMGFFELTGSHTLDELRIWIDRSATNTGAADYLQELLSQQQLDKAQQLVTAEPSVLLALVELTAATNTPMVIRIGVSAIMEGLANTGELKSLVSRIGELTHSEEANIRADAAHYLGLSGALSARQWLQPMLYDEHEHVREIAHDSLQKLVTPDGSCK